MSNLNICIDIDGTITSPYHFIPYLNNMYNKNLSNEDCTTLDWTELYGEDIEDILNKFHNEYMNAYEEAEVIEGARDIIKELYERNNLYFVTARSESLTGITTNWLNKNGFSDIEVYLLGSDYKIEKAKELNCNLFIEDNPSNAIQIAEAGINVILMDANYNKGTEHERITRVKDWKQINELIENHYYIYNGGGDLVIELKLKNRKGNFNVNSKEVMDILKLRPDFEYVQDISNTINQDNIMVFDCQLSEDIFAMEDIEELLEEMGENLDESYFNVIFEDVRVYLKDATDEIEAELQDIYLVDNIRCFFDVYNIDEGFTDFKFVFVVSFEDIKIASLTNLAKIVAKRQLVGASKFYS